MKNTLEHIIVVLGAPNDENGLLSNIAISRLNKCLEIYRPGSFVLCTGGWGANFNQAPQSHAHYASKYLISNGIDKTHFLEFALSAHTVEDAVKTKKIIEPFLPVKLSLITSDFHLERAQLIFDKILQIPDIEYIGAPTNMAKKSLEQLITHEKKSIEEIIKNGLYY